MKKTKTGLFVFAVFTIIASFFGCAVSTYDKLPDGVPKGYVEFYPEAGAAEIDDWATWYVTKYENGHEKRYDLVIWDGNTRRRIAEPPGRHTFVVRMGTAAHKVSVIIRDGMVTPVKVTLKEKGREYGHLKKIYHFDMSLEVEDATPLSN